MCSMKNLSKKIKRVSENYSLVIPVLVIIFIIVIFPLIYGFCLSLYKTTPGAAFKEFVGFDNYFKVLSSNRFYQSVLKSFYYVGICIFFKVIIGLGAALLLNKKFKGRGIIRGIAIIPWTIPVFVTALIWLWMFDWRGVLNLLLRNIGFPRIRWLSPHNAMNSIVMVNVWKGFPFFMIGLLAGLQAIPNELYEAAVIDRATRWQIFWYITLPLLKPVLLTVSLLSTLWTFSEIIPIYIITRGGPARVTEVIPMYTYITAFNLFDVNKAIAIAIVTLPIYLVLIFGIGKVLRQS